MVRPRLIVPRNNAPLLDILRDNKFMQMADPLLVGKTEAKSDEGAIEAASGAKLRLDRR